MIYFLYVTKMNTTFSIDDAIDYFARKLRWGKKGYQRAKLGVYVSEEISWAIGRGLVKQLAPLSEEFETYDQQKVFLRIAEVDTLGVVPAETLDDDLSICHILFAPDRIELTTLFGKIIGKQLVVHCPHCRTKHFHGWPSGGDKPQHRVAHCHKPNSPFFYGGYYIAPAKEVVC
jgi:hypothetical protein